MKARGLQAILASLAILSAAWIAHVIEPRTMMARSAEDFSLEQIIPKAFGEWTVVPDVRLIEPDDPDSLAHQLYSQELARGYRDRDGHLVMLLIAYGPNQSQRLQLHRPEICYVAAGFRVSRTFAGEVTYSDGGAPLRTTRLIAERESRLEPITYWMRVGNEIATGVLDRQLIRIKFLFRGIVPDGALFRVSTIGLPVEVAYEVQTKFIRDWLNTVTTNDLDFVVGDHARLTSVSAVSK